MSKIFKPRRGIKSVMVGSKAATVLSKGEFFMECPDTGVGTGKSKIKMGDGVTPYIDLPYAIAGMDSEDPVELANKTYTDQSTALNDVKSGNSLKTVLNALKSAVKLNSDSVNALNDDSRLDEILEKLNDLHQEQFGDGMLKKIDCGSFQWTSSGASGTIQSYNVKNVLGDYYKRLTVSDFIIGPFSFTGNAGSSGHGDGTTNGSIRLTAYDNTQGIVSATGTLSGRFSYRGDVPAYQYCSTTITFTIWAVFIG